VTDHAKTLAIVLAYLKEVGVEQPTEATKLSQVLHQNNDIYAFHSDAPVPAPEPGEVTHLLRWVEQTFGFEVEPDEISLDNFATPSTLACYIDRRLDVEAQT
jgi:hypothetical protein